MKRLIVFILLAVSIDVYSQSIFNSTNYSFIEIGGNYNNEQFYFEAMGSFTFLYLNGLGTLQIRPELNIESLDDGILFGWSLSALYGYALGVHAFNIFLYGGYRLSNTYSLNSFYGAKLLFSGFGVYAEYTNNLPQGISRYSLGISFAFGRRSLYSPPPTPKPSPRPPEPAPEPPSENNKRTRDYF